MYMYRVSAVSGLCCYQCYNAGQHQPLVRDIAVILDDIERFSLIWVCEPKILHRHLSLLSLTAVSWIQQWNLHAWSHTGESRALSACSWACL